MDDYGPSLTKSEAAFYTDFNKSLGTLGAGYGPSLEDAGKIPKGYYPKKRKPVLTGLEAKFAQKLPTVYRGAKDISMVAPIGWAAFPSERKAIRELGGLPLLLGLTAAEALAWIPGLGIGASKVVSTGLKSVLGAFKTTKGFVRPSVSKVAKSAIIQPGETIARKELAKDLLFMKRMERTEWIQKVKSAPELTKYFSGGGSINHLFKTQAKLLFGRHGAKLEIGNVTSKTMHRMLIDLPGRVPTMAKLSDLTGIAYVRPVRKAMGAGEAVFGTYTKGFLPVTKAYGERNALEFHAIEEFQAMLAEKGLGTIQKRQFGPNKFTRNFSVTDEQQAGILVHKIDEMTRKGMSPTKLQGVFSGSPATVQEIAKTYWQWTDVRYCEHITEKIHQAMSLVGLSEHGKGLVNWYMINKFQKNMWEILNPSHNIGSHLKAPLIQKELDGLKNFIIKHPERYTLFLPGPVNKQLNLLSDHLTMEAQGGKLLNYLENYAQRIAIKQEEKFVGFGNRIFNRTGAGYTKARTAEEVAPTVEMSIGRMVEARASMQANELVMTPFLSPTGEFGKYVSTLPSGYKKYMMHYVSRLLGRPSPMDTKIAVFINKSFGTTISGSQIDKVAQEVNNLFFMGTLGAKPFSAMRNLFDPIKAIPDLGGIAEAKTFARGIAWASNPINKDYLLKLGVVQEYAPELFAKLRALPAGKAITIAGKTIQLPEMDTVRDALLWMFSKSDQWGRLATGGMAHVKWETALSKLGTKTNIGQVLRSKDLKAFHHTAGINGRDPHIQDQIKMLLRNQEYEEARQVYIKDVVGDVNFLYGKEDAPLGIYTAGAPGKVSAIFQSWTVNYIELINKWARTKEVPTKALAWLSSSAAAYCVMEQLWGDRRARESVFLGPVLNPNMPIAWQPVLDGVKGILQAGTGDFKAAGASIKSILNSSVNLVPAGSQLSSMLRAYERGGTREAIPAIGAFHRGKLYEFLKGKQ